MMFCQEFYTPQGNAVHTQYRRGRVAESKSEQEKGGEETTSKRVPEHTQNSRIRFIFETR